jgi:DNA-binding response OmpR family regulator
MTMDHSPNHVTSQLLVADEDQITCAFLHDNLSADGYQVDAACNHNAALGYLRDTAPDLILVDVNGNTLALVDHVRRGEHGLCAAAPDTPIIALTSYVEEVQRVRLLERGSDDVITKPFSYPELRARVGALLRRTAPRQPSAVLTAGPVRIDRRQRAVTVHDRAVQVGGLEYELLCVLATEPGRVFTRNELMNAIWGYSNTYTRTLDSHASRLRHKLSTDTHRLVINVWGVGYRLLDGAQP